MPELSAVREIHPGLIPPGMQPGQWYHLYLPSVTEGFPQIFLITSWLIHEHTGDDPSLHVSLFRSQVNVFHQAHIAHVALQQDLHDMQIVSSIRQQPVYPGAQAVFFAPEAATIDWDAKAIQQGR